LEQNLLCGTAPIHYRGWVDQKTALTMFGALAQETRFSAFRMLGNEPEGLSSGEIAQRLNVPQNTMSTHMGILARAGLVSSERQSRSVIYRAEPLATKALDRFLTTQ
jgi:ArsR family transcriptional regulator, arsenate/arsenite/antimonite-responsive transcriptional repressor